MKSLWLLLSLVTFTHMAIAETTDLPVSEVISVDNLELSPASEEASLEALPQELYSEDFTIVPTNLMNDFFQMFTKDLRARNRYAGGNCAVRRVYIQNYLKRHHIKSGNILITCPGNRGNMQLVDRATNHRYTFANFHDANIVADPNGLNVLDVQFTDGPMTLSAYLALVEASQKLKPLEERSSSDRGYCYWQIK